MAGTLVAEALAKGDMGLAVATLAPGSVATALGLWGTDEQQETYLPAFTGDDVPAAALALNEPTVLFDVLSPSTTATKERRRLRPQRRARRLVARGAEAELFVVGAELDGKPVLFLVESSTDGLTRRGRPRHGRPRRRPDHARPQGRQGRPRTPCSARPTARRTLECVRLSRLAWCALAVGTGQAVLDYVTPYVNEREAFGEPIATASRWRSWSPTSRSSCRRCGC